ncbi:DUF2336 domain-containing protein [Limobrevibacterium gyesilva]|uniref:DUF2336 domain-containing protein n=1 Tax=Limobrevibacterium gyesilva TaxID=2991712 RepID=A0AA41YM39_9PROT|nr:DUF2336 domain-containing protein [Limobrevibacterium gyesilva]MCW3474832.1 DUF2336 domain-containing protein [Limobrevibacterium gyesilva]
MADIAGAARPAPDVAARVRLGANPETAPDLLLALASDPAVTVRAAVAMNTAAPSQVDRLLALDADERVRTLLARKLASLIPGLPPTQRDRLQQQALATLAGLVEDEAERVRAAIADVVKDMPEVPRELVLRLARDSAVSVCEPVIRLSPLLTAEDLMALLAAQPSPVTATAVARRPGLPESVADAVAATADTGAIAALLSNASAAIREATLDALIARAAEATEWHGPLVRRPVLTTRAARALSEIVATQFLDALSRRGDLDPALTAELRRRLSARLDTAAHAARPEPNIAQAMAEAQHLYAEGKLNEGALLGAVQQGEARLATALLAVAADVPASVVDRAATLRSAKGLVSLVWKAGFSMRAAGPLQTLLARLSPERILRGTCDGGFPLAIEEMRWQIDFLSRMGR